MRQSRIFLIAGLLSAGLLAMTAVRLVAGLGTSQQPTPLGTFDIPAFSQLLDCDAHFSHEILRLNSNLPAHNTTDDLRLLHRNYRRLHRLLRQVGRRDGIASEEQSRRLRERVKQLNASHDTSSAAQRDARCRAMAEMPIARKRHSQLIIGE